MLDGEEQQRLARLRHADSRHLFLVSHALQRSVLGELLGEAPAGLAFSRSPEGKPALLRPPGAATLAFNLSHSGTLAALAVAPGGSELGVDVELHRGGRRFEALARRFFSEAEKEAVLRAGEKTVAGVFYGTWTRKEAWLKARGSGIRVPLADFGIHREGRSLAFSATRALESSPADWRFWEWSLDQPASLSLAIRDPGGRFCEPEILWGAPLVSWAPLGLSPPAASHW